MTAALTERAAAGIPASSRPSIAPGLDGLRYLVLERKVVADESQTQAVLAFAGARRGIASWLAAPAPMGALDFVSPYAQGAAAFVFKGPALVFDDLVGLIAIGRLRRPRDELARLESKLDLSLREDLAATLGGEFALALDGPLLPTPAWKLVVEVYDPARLQSSLELLVTPGERRGGERGAARPPARVRAGGRGDVSFPAAASCPSSCTTPSPDGYLVAAPSRALVMQAIRTRESGETLGRSARFRALFPPDRDAHVSGLVYQNMGPTIRSLLAGARREPAQPATSGARSRP